MPEAASGGMFLAVVGPSGAGKDSLIALAQRRLGGDPRYLFVRRVVTRPATAAAEDHDTLDEDAFEAARTAGRFCVTWEAHGLRYGLPAGALDHVRGGGKAVANCSRAALPSICAAFPAVTVLAVTAPPEVLAARLAGRGRESADDVARRLARKVDDFPQAANVIVIDNGGALEIAGARFVEAIEGVA